MSKPFVIYRSSAGSGKTYTLTKEYLKLAFKNPEYFKNILAVTFTNKATKEMKSRILEVLSGLVKGGHPLAFELKEHTGLDDEALKQRAREVLSSLLHNYSYFSVSTIDSFFQKVIRAFAREMGLQGGFRIELDEDLVMNEVIDKVLLDVGKDSNLTNWLIKFAETRVDDGKTWDTRREIGNLAKEIFQENFKLLEPEVLSSARDEHFIPNFLKELDVVKSTFEDELKAIGRQGMSIIGQHQLDVTDFAYKEGGPAGYLEKLSLGKITAPGIRIESAALSANTWFAKSNPIRARVKEAAEDGLVDLLQQAVTHYKKHQVPYESASEVLRYLYTYGILADLTGKLQEYRDENEVMLISDAAVFLKQIIADTEAPFVYEKVGSRYRHYLIDEFQDTSGFQWDNFKPLIENSLAENNYNLVVGDVKQSIYRWRGGDLELLLQQVEQQIGRERVDFQNLQQNWRSLPNIVDFNNSIFRFAQEVLSNQVVLKLEEVVDDGARESLLEAADKISQAYHQVVQESAKQSGENRGLVKFRFYPWLGANELEWKDNVLIDLPAQIEELQDQKYALKDIAILVRTRSEGRAVIDYLLQYQSTKISKDYKYDVISSESLFLENSSITRFLVACLKYLYKPDDAIQRVQMAYEWHQYIRPDQLPLNSLFGQAADQVDSSRFEELLPNEFFDKIGSIRKESVYQMIEELISLFELEKFFDERAYLQGFLDAVLDFTKNENDDIASFLNWWEEIGRERTVMVSEEQDAIRVMTIHMAKGLQFKAVLVPFCDWNIDGLQGFDNILWSKSDQPPFNNAPFLPLNYTTKLKNTVFYQDFYQELIRSYLDNLNLLYVAFTRAEEVLFVASPQHKSKSEIRASSGIVDQYFDSEFRLNGFEDRHLNDYKEQVFGEYPGVGVEQVSGIESVYLEEFPVNNWHDRIVVKRSFTESNPNALVDPTIVLTIINRLESLNQLDKVIQTVFNEGVAHFSQKTEVRKAVLAILSIDKVRPWFDPSVSSVLQPVVLSPDRSEFQIDRIVYHSETTLIKYIIGEVGSEEIDLFHQACGFLSQPGKPAKGVFLRIDTGEVINLNKPVEE